MKPRYLFMESAPALQGKAREFGRNYRRFAIVKVSPLFSGTPKMISERARGVVEVVEDIVIHVGETMRSAGFRRMHEMIARTEELNA